jgi:uncharacterized membrane protein YccC
MLSQETRVKAESRGKNLRDNAVIAQAALTGAHGATAKALAEEGLDASQRAHTLALYRWEQSLTRPLEPDERRAVKAALEATNLEHALRVVAVEVRKEIAAANPPKGARR